MVADSHRDDGSSSSITAGSRPTDPSSSRHRAFFLGPPGTYSHSVARAVFHRGTRPSAPPGPAGAADAAASNTGRGPSVSTRSDDGEVELIPCTTLTGVLHAALEAAGAARVKAFANGNGAASAPAISTLGRCECAYAVMPIENSTFGPVRETLDALARGGVSVFSAAATPEPPLEASTATDSSRTGPSIIGEYHLPVSHTLLAGPRTKRKLRQLASRASQTRAAQVSAEVSQLRLEHDGAEPQGGLDAAEDHEQLEVDELVHLDEILSHEQALGQCAGFLAAHASRAQTTPVSSTALAAKEALDKDSLVQVEEGRSDSGPCVGSNDTQEPHGGQLVAAVGSELCAEVYGLSVLRRSIEDRSDNTTRFIIVQIPSTSSRIEHRRSSLDAALLPYKGAAFFGGS